MAGLGGALAGLSGAYGGYKQGMMDEYKLDDVRRQELAKVAMGNALKMLGAGQQGQGGGGLPQMGQPPGMPPGPPQQPMQPSPGQPGPGRPGPGGMPPSAGTGMPPGGPQPGAMGGPAPPGMQGPAMVPGGAPAQGGMPQMGGRPQQGGQLDWRQLVQSVQQANPNIPPDVLAEAVNQFLPLMNQQSQMEWKQVLLQIREQALQQREHDFMLSQQFKADEGQKNREFKGGEGEKNREFKADEGQKNRDFKGGENEKNRVSHETIAKMTVDERREAMEAGIISRQEIVDAMIASREKEGAANRESHEKIADKRLTEADMARAGRERLAERRLDQQQQQFTQHEQRLQEGLKLREDSTWTRLEQQKQAAIQRAEQSQWKQGMADIKTLIDEQDRHVRTKIAAANVLGPEKKKLLEDADRVNSEQLAALRARAKGGGSPPAAPSTPAAPTEPPAADNAPTATGPDGKKVKWDGKAWVPMP